MNKKISDTVANILIVGGSVSLALISFYESRKRRKIEKELEWQKAETDVFKDIDEMQRCIIRDLDHKIVDKDQIIKELRKNIES